MIISHEFTGSIRIIWIGEPVLMVDKKVYKDKYISRGTDRENLVYVRWNSIKNCTLKGMVMGTEKRNIELNEFEPIDNINNP